MKNFAVQSGEHRVLIYIAILGITIGVTVTLIPYAGIGMAFLLSAVVLSVLFFRRYELIIVLILISSVMPEIYIPNVLFDLKLTPDFVFLVYGFLLWIFILLTTTNSDPEHKFNLGPITLPAVLFSFVILLSAVISENNVVSLLKGIRLIFWYVIWIYILVVFLKTEKRIYNTLLLLVITIGVLSVISLVELLETVPISSLVSATGRLAGRFMGLSIGEYLSFAILVVFTFWIFSRRFYIKVLYSIAVMVFFALLLLSQTRMAFIATFIGYLFVLMALPRMTKYKLILFGTPVMILLIAIAIVPEQSRFHSFISISDLVISPQSSDYSSWTRALLWKRSLELIIQHPILGVGPGLGPTKINLAFHRGLLLDPHNAYLSIFLETGLPGLFFFLWIVIACWLVVFKTSRDSSLTPELRQIAIAILGVLTAALIIGVTGSFFSGGLGTFFTSLLAMAIACYRLARLQRMKNTKAVNTPLIEGV